MAKKKVESKVDREDLINSLVESLNSEHRVAYSLINDAEINPATIKGWIPTGNEIVDLMISNTRHGGLPLGRVTEISGMESSGKSLFVAHALAEVQKQGGIAVLIDTEFAISAAFLVAIGVDVEKLIYIPCNILEDVLGQIELIINKLREAKNEKPALIVVDSIMGSSTSIEAEGDWGKDGWATGKAIILSKAMRLLPEMIAQENIALVFTNQLRANLGAMFGEKWTTSGGKAIPFAASLRLKLNKLAKIKNGAGADADVLGVKTRLDVFKSRLGSAFRKIEFDIYFDRGMDSSSSWVQAAEESGAIVKSKTKTTMFRLFDDADEKVIFKKTEFSEILKDPIVKEKVYNIIADAFIMTYKDRSTIDDMDKSGFVADESED
jgi:recombination protein RecA